MPIFKTNFAYSIFYFSAKIHLFFLYKKNKIGFEKILIKPTQNVKLG